MQSPEDDCRWKPQGTLPHFAADGVVNCGQCSIAVDGVVNCGQCGIAVDGVVNCGQCGIAVDGVENTRLRTWRWLVQFYFRQYLPPPPTYKS